MQVLGRNQHAIEMLNNAAAGLCPWTRCNDNPPNIRYDAGHPENEKSKWLPGKPPRDVIEKLTLKYIAEMARMPALDAIVAHAESDSDRAARHARIAERRAGPAIIVHRGAWAFAPENSLAAYAAAMDCGADGCEVDLRRTRDGVLVMFHDDMLDRLTMSSGRVGDLTYREFAALPSRRQFGRDFHGGATTFAAVLNIARQRAMLLHLDVKEPGLEDDITLRLDEADAWEHVVSINTYNSARLRQNPKFKPLAYKGPGLSEQRRDMDPAAVRAQLERPGQMIMVDDPRVAVLALKRAATWPARPPVSAAPAAKPAGAEDRIAARAPALIAAFQKAGTETNSVAEFCAKTRMLAALAELRSDAGKKFLLDYVAKDEAQARTFGYPHFEDAVRALLCHELYDGELAALLRSKHSAVRGTAILECVDRPTDQRLRALKDAAPWAQELTRPAEGAALLHTASAPAFVRTDSPTAGIQEAINALPQSGGAVKLPAGDYALRQSIVLRSNVTLAGAGPDTVLHKVRYAESMLAAPAQKGSRTVRVANAGGFAPGDPVAIRDQAAMGWNVVQAIVRSFAGNELMLDRPMPRTCEPAKHGFVILCFPAVLGERASGFVLKDYAIKEDHARDLGVHGALDLKNPRIRFAVGLPFPLAAIQLVDATDARVEGVSIHGWMSDGISLQRGANDTVVNCLVEKCAGKGLHAGGGLHDSAFSRNISRENDDDGFFFCAKTRKLLVSENTLTGNKGHGVGGLGESDDKFNTITKNVISSNGLQIGRASCRERV